MNRMTPAPMVLGMLLAFGLCAGAVAQEGAAPGDPDEILLKVTVVVPGWEGVRDYDRGDLAAMRTVVFRTSTIWTNGVLEFRGVPLSEIVRQAGVDHGTVMMSAANDYVTDIPVAEIEPDAPIVAYAIDGKALTLREKGPLWVVYPYDFDTDYQTEVIFTRSVWQLTSIVIEP
jgi:hypothetical protein